MSQAKGFVIEIGAITTVDEDGDRTHYPMAMLVQFSDPEEIRRALSDQQLSIEVRLVPLSEEARHELP